MNQKFNKMEDRQAREISHETMGPFPGGYVTAVRRPTGAVDSGRAAVWQARLVLLVMINIAQLWILAATIEAALAWHYGQLLPLVIASGICWLIALTIFLWWKPASRRHTSTGYIRRR
jgi:hypothetical protein